MSHGIFKQALLLSTMLTIVLSCVMLMTSAAADVASETAGDACVSNLDLTGSAEAACEQGFNSYNAQGSPSKTGVCNSAKYPDINDRAACRQGWDSAGNVDPAVDCGPNTCDLIAKYINPGINLFSAIFGLVAVVSLIFGGIQFSASEGDPQKASQAKSRISNTILAILSYFFLYAFLQFLIPGGAFK